MQDAGPSSASYAPGVKRIRTRSIPNVETERLLGRLAFVRARRASLLRDADQKQDVRALAREMVNVERELTRRGVAFLCATDGAHLSIDVWDVPEIRPPASWKERRAKAQ